MVRSKAAALVYGIWLGLAATSGVARADAVIVDAPDHPVTAGRHSVFADFQIALQRRLATCPSRPTDAAPPANDLPGVIGRGTRAAIQSAVACGLLGQVPEQTPARNGALTESVWTAVMNGQPRPSVQDRIMALVLSFEATDFGAPPEWNFCQDTPVTPGQPVDPKAPGFVCINRSDPCSFLTWGPRGATAGSGREIQAVFDAVSRRRPEVLEEAFGAELPSVRRFMTLRSSKSEDCRNNTPLERFMCAVWIDPARRAAWDRALATLGASPVVREAYADVYASKEYDGNTLAGYFDLWKAIGLEVNEVDAAFFVDRTTHFGGPWTEGPGIVRQLARCIERDRQGLTPDGKARRCLSQLQPHPDQPDDRQARDVAFYLDDYPEGALSKEEIETWARFVPLSAATNLGLSRRRTVGRPAARPLRDIAPLARSAPTGALTAKEANACPRTVLSPVRDDAGK